MSRTKTVLVLTRGPRLHRLYREMAQGLGRDHRVVVLATPQEAASFSSIDGVEVRCYRTPDIATVPSDGWMGTDAEIKAKARLIEQRIGLRLYKAASNFLLYGRMVKQYGGPWNYLGTERDILRAYVGAYEDLSRIFDDVKPDVVLYEVIDRISNYVAFALAYSRGIFALDFQPAPLSEGRGSFGFGLHRKNILLEYLYAHRDAIHPSSYAAADDILGRRRDALYETFYARVNRNLLHANSLFHLGRVRQLVTTAGTFRNGLRNVRLHARSIANRPWLARHLRRTIPDPPYLVFFLQYMPEARTCAEAPRWVYQDAVVEQLAINAPSGLRIVVKEHPRSYGRRGRAFFMPLKDLPNVELCHPSVDNYELVSRAEAVVAVTGTVGFEGLLLGKRVGVLGRPFYSAYPGVRALNVPEEIYDALEDPSWRPEGMAQERRDFLAAYVQSLHDFGMGTATSLYPERGGAKWARALRETLQLIDRYQLRPAEFDTGIPELVMNVESCVA